MNYNNLAHGRYQFKVRAELPGGTANEASFDFDLLPHFYESSWFRALIAVALALLVWGAYRLRVRQVHSRFGMVLEERARLAREVHDTLAQAFVGISSQLDVVEMCLPPGAEPALHSLERRHDAAAGCQTTGCGRRKKPGQRRRRRARGVADSGHG